LSSSINFHMSIRKFKHIRFIRLRLTTFPDVSLDLLPVSSWWPWFRLANRWVFVISAFDPPINPQLRFSLFDAWWTYSQRVRINGRFASPMPSYAIILNSPNNDFRGTRSIISTRSYYCMATSREVKIAT
jgi:hypothetical protein